MNKPELTEELHDFILDLWNDGWSCSEIADEVGCSYQFISSIVHKY